VDPSAKFLETSSVLHRDFRKFDQKQMPGGPKGQDFRGGEMMRRDFFLRILIEISTKIGIFTTVDEYSDKPFLWFTVTISDFCCGIKFQVRFFVKSTKIWIFHHCITAHCRFVCQKSRSPELTTSWFAWAWYIFRDVRKH